jgi:hypothetical protein
VGFPLLSLTQKHRIASQRGCPKDEGEIIILSIPKALIFAHFTGNQQLKRVDTFGLFSTNSLLIIKQLVLEKTEKVSTRVNPLSFLISCLKRHAK